MRHTLSKQETCKGAAAAMAETAALKQASCSITLDSQFSMQLTTDEFSACPDNMSIWEACTFVTASSVAKSESIADCTTHVSDSQQEQSCMFQEVVTLVVKKFTRSKLLFSALGAIMERYEVYVAIFLILAVYLCGKFGDEFEIRKKKAGVVGEVSPKGKETVEEEEEEEEEAEEETEEEEKQTKKEAKQSSGEAKGKKSEEPGQEKKKTASTSTASSAKKVPELEEEVVRLQALVDEKEQAINDLADDLL